MIQNRGFTLIELLVVIAIIGVLSSVVLASLSTARGKGADASIKTNLANIRAQAEMLYDTNGVYAVDTTPTYFALAQCANTADTLFSNSNIWSMISSANRASTNNLANTRCFSSANAWAVAVQLKTGGDSNTDTIPDSWCVDGSGVSKSYIWTAGQTIADSININRCR